MNLYPLYMCVLSMDQYYCLLMLMNTFHARTHKTVGELWMPQNFLQLVMVLVSVCASWRPSQCHCVIRLPKAVPKIKQKSYPTTHQRYNTEPQITTVIKYFRGKTKPVNGLFDRKVVKLCKGLIMVIETKDNFRRSVPCTSLKFDNIACMARVQCSQGK